LGMSPSIKIIHAPNEIRKATEGREKNIL
jgi:hypothetical protein